MFRVDGYFKGRIEGWIAGYIIFPETNSSHPKIPIENSHFQGLCPDFRMQVANASCPRHHRENNNMTFFGGVWGPQACETFTCYWVLGSIPKVYQYEDKASHIWVFPRIGGKLPKWMVKISWKTLLNMG